MVEGKEGIAKKDFLILFGTLILIGFILFVWAAISAPRLDSPTTGYNYSGTLNFTCFGAMETAYNATLFIFNESGVITANNISTITNISANDTNFSSTTVDISMLKDGRYNVSCRIINVSDSTGETGTIYSANTSNITIDNTGPAVTFYGISDDYINGSFVISALVVDATSNITMGGDVYVNITTNNVTASQVNFTNITAYTGGAGYYNLTIGNGTLADGKYNVTIYANDSNSTCCLRNGLNAVVANLNNSETISITIDTVSPTATYECTPSSVTIGQLVTCICTGSDATSGINYTYDGTTTSSTASLITKITTRSAGTFSRSCIVKDRAGNTISTDASASYTVTIPVSSSSGGTSGTTPSTTSTSTTATITPTSPATISNFASSSGIKEIQVEVTETANNVQINIGNYETNVPSAVPSSVTGTYKYLKIDTQNLADKLSKATMKIQVEKSWVDNQGIAKEDVSLFKYDETNNQWNELATTYSSEDNTYYYYTVELTSFSYFAIAPKGAEILSEGEEEGITTEEKTTGFLGLPYWVWIVIILVIAIIIGGGAALRKKK